MNEQLEFPLPPKDEIPKQDTGLHIRLRAMGKIRDNMDTEHLMRYLDRVALKHHDSIPEIDKLMNELGVGEAEDFDEYDY